MYTVRLAVLYPHMVDRTCERCKEYQYNDKPNDMALEPVILADTSYMKRPKGVPTPCSICPKLPRGKSPEPANAIEPTQKSLQAFWHYQKCRAVGRFPEDAVVESNAVVIGHCLDSIERIEKQEGTEAIKTLAKIFGK